MLRMIAAAGVAVTAAGLIACGERLTEADVDAMVETRVAEAFIQATAEARVMESLAPTATPPPTATHTPSPTPTATPPPTATHTPSPAPIPTGRIAFASGDLEDENFGIYVMDADGSDVSRLTTMAEIEGFPLLPSWSPDGRRMAFESGRDGNLEIYVTNEDGLGVTRLTNNTAPDVGPSWSPDGQRIAFLSERDGNSEIYVKDVDGLSVTRLTNNTALDAYPSWSPDGRRIVFHSERDGNSEIYVMNADGADVTRLTNHPESDYSPSWSPDGRRIAFGSNRDGNDEIYVMDADGSNVTRLTNNTAWDISPSWSLDSQLIAFTSLDLEDVNWRIYVMNADGSGLTQLRSSTEFEIVLSWLPQSARTIVLPVEMSMPTATPVPTATPTPAPLRLDRVRQRGRLICAGNNALLGFGAVDSAGGNSVGFDIDLCRAVAVAVLGDADALDIRPTTAAERGAVIQSGEVDILSRNTTWTNSRDVQWGNFAQAMFYDGRGFMVRKDSSISNLMELANARVCVQQGTITELNLQDFSNQNNLNIDILVYPEVTGARRGYQNEQCDALTTDRAALASVRASFPTPDDHMILPGTLSEEPLGPMVPHGDEQWYDIVKTVMAILIYAEAYEVTSGSVPTAATGHTEVDRLFGLEGSFGQEGMGLKRTVAQDVIRAVGNYGEIYDRHLTPLGLIREGSRNALWSGAPCNDCPKGGQIYAVPLR